MRDFWKKELSPYRTGGIRRRLLVWGLSLFGIALLVIVVAGYSYTVRQIRQDAAAFQSELASVTGEQIRDFVRRKIERFSDTADALSLYQLGSKEQQLLLGLLTKNDSSFTHASIINSQGMEVVKVSDRKVYFPSDLTDQSKSPKFIKALGGEDYISPVYSSTRAQPYITLAIPLWGTAQRIVGVVSVEADLSFLWEAIGKIHFGTAGYAYLVDEHGNLIAHRDPALVLKRMNLGRVDGVKKFLRNPTRPDPTPASDGRGLTSSPVLVTYAPVPELGWSVILEEPVDAALANVEILKRLAMMFLAVGLFVGATIIAWVSQKITSPIQELRRHVATIGAGNLEHRADIRTGDEIEELAAEFNKMTDALQNSYATLEHKVDQRTKEISALYSVTTAVNESLALTNILDAVIAKIAEIFRFESTRVLLFDDEMEKLEVQASFETDPEYSTPTRTFKRGEGIVGRVAESAEPMIFEDIRTDPRYAALSVTKAKYNVKLSFFAVFPIKTQSRVFGVILFNARSPRKLTSDEIRLLTSMSEHLAVAVEKARLFRQSERRSQQLSVLNTELEQINRELKEANHAKDEFLSVMSHELRTPLNVVTGYAEILRQGVLGELQSEQNQAVRTISVQSRELLRMINEVLQVGSLQAGKVTARLQESNLRDLLVELQATYEILSKEGVPLYWNIPSILPTVKTDGEKVKHVLQNLINNAIKFTEKGSVTISARCISETIEFKVKDTGMGMPEDKLPTIFEMFKQLDSSETRSFGGAGVGLYIVKKFIELLHGTIEVESVLTEGTTFTVTIPMKVSEESLREANDEVPTQLDSKSLRLAGNG